MSFVLTRPPATDDELYWVIYALWGVKIPREPVCPNHSTPFAAFAEAYFARAPVSVWKASRGMGGKSRTLAYLTLTEAVLLGAEVNILGGSGAQSINIHEAMRDGWNSPLAPRLMLANDSMYETRLTNGAKVRALLASQRSVRGPHPQRLRLDEVDEMDVSILDSALGQPMPHKDKPIDTSVVASSTHQYPDKTMTEMLKRAAQEGYPVHEWSIAQGSLVLTDRGEVPIEDVALTDYLWTRKGWKPVQHVSRMGEQPTLILELSNGRTLRLTGDHRVATEDGWVRAENLEAGSVLTGAVVDLHARPAVPPVVTGGHVRVLRGVLMPPWTVGACDLCGDVGCSSHVLPVGNGLQMGRSNTHPVAAQMVDLLVLGDRSNEQPVSQAMSETLTGLPVDHAVAEGVGFAGPEAAVATLDRPTEDVVPVVGDGEGTGPALPGLPLPADGLLTVPASKVHVTSVRTGAVLPVWDIGVEDEHEFVAEGVVVHNCWRETSNPVDGWLSQSYIARQRKVIPKRMWEVEYDLQEPSFGSRAFDTEEVEKMFQGYGDTPDHPGREVYKHHDVDRGEQYEFEPPDPKHGEYVTGADWAKERDWTVIVTFRVDCDPWRLVAYSRTRRKPYPVMIKLMNKRMERYPGDGIHDGTGLGNVVNDYLDQRATPFIMSGRARDDMLSEYVSAVESGKLVAPKIESAYTEHKYCSLEDLYGRGKDVHLPDTVCAFALAWHKRNRRTRKVRPIIDVTHEDGSPWRAVG
jgi:hypothetical protein